MFVEELEAHGQDIIESAFFAAAENSKNADGVPIDEAVIPLIQAGRSGARYAPTAKIILDATLDITARPDIAPDLPKEIYRRGKSAAEVVLAVVKYGVDNNLFESIFRASPIYEQEAKNPIMLKPFSNKPYLFSLVGSQFSDVSVVSGGALLKLRDQRGEARPDETDTIVRSTGLLAISGVEKQAVPQVLAIMGSPYILPSYLQVKSDEAGDRVSFIDPAKKILEQFYLELGGCPFGRLKSPIDPSNTRLRDEWERLVGYFIQPDSTIDMPTRQRWAVQK